MLINLELAAHYMDDDIREYLHSNLAENVDFLKEYKRLHMEKFGEHFSTDWSLNGISPR